MLFTPTLLITTLRCLCPRLAARSPVSGASLRARQAAECIIDERARPRRGGLVSNGGVRYSGHVGAHRHIPLRGARALRRVRR